ncbi:MAG: hypothetical protein JHD28_08850, partial [Bacteroidia bacterium]|nr:hypothetical protein [Bacteroidia bacterium]
ISFSHYNFQDKAVKDSLGSKNWIKTDYDNNGETDLLLFNLGNLYEIIVVFSNNGLFKRYNSNASMRFKYSEIYPTIKKIDNKNFLLIYHRNKTRYDYELNKRYFTSFGCDTVVFMNGYFLNYYPNLEKPKIKRIKITSTSSEVSGVVVVDINFITLKSDCFQSEGKFPSKNGSTYKLTKAEILKFKYLLENSNFVELNNNEHYNIDDCEQYKVKIMYDNDNEKEFEDVGGVVNYNFSEIYNMMYNFKWVKSK